MRIFSVAIALSALVVIGFAAHPATANCHAKLEAAEEKLSAIPKDMGVRQQIKKMIGNAKKFKDHKKKKKKCKKILARVHKLIKKVEKQAGKEGIGGCAALIEQAEMDRSFINQGARELHAKWMINIAEAKKYDADGKKRKCVQLMKQTIKQIGILREKGVI